MYFSRDDICIFLNAQKSKNFGSFSILELITCIFSEMPNFFYVRFLNAPETSWRGDRPCQSPKFKFCPGSCPKFGRIIRVRSLEKSLWTDSDSNPCPKSWPCPSISGESFGLGFELFSTSTFDRLLSANTKIWVSFIWWLIWSR